MVSSGTSRLKKGRMMVENCLSKPAICKAGGGTVDGRNPANHLGSIYKTS